MLPFQLDVSPGAGDGAPVLVLLHGRGSDEHDLLGLGPHLIPGAVTVTPRAPHPGAPWGYGPGWAWYRFLGRNQPEPASFVVGQEALGEFLAELPPRLPLRPGPVVLGGFSQGGTMSVAYALRNPGVVKQVICWSGFLADHPSVAATPATVAGTRFFWGHGTMDPSIPFRFGEEARTALRVAGADLTTWDGPTGHGISPEELRETARWLALGAVPSSTR